MGPVTSYWHGIGLKLPVMVALIVWGWQFSGSAVANCIDVATLPWLKYKNNHSLSLFSPLFGITHVCKGVSGTSVTRSEHSGDCCSTASDTSSVCSTLVANPPVQMSGTLFGRSMMELAMPGWELGA